MFIPSCVCLRIRRFYSNLHACIPSFICLSAKTLYFFMFIPWSLVLWSIWVWKQVTSSKAQAPAYRGIFLLVKCFPFRLPTEEDFL
jgi:hypothetical protein